MTIEIRQICDSCGKTRTIPGIGEESVNAEGWREVAPGKHFCKEDIDAMMIDNTKTDKEKEAEKEARQKKRHEERDRRVAERAEREEQKAEEATRPWGSGIPKPADDIKTPREVEIVQPEAVAEMRDPQR